MKKEEIIHNIIKLFKLDSSSLKDLEHYEYELIYNSLNNVDSKSIDKAIKSYTNKEFRIRTIRTSFW